MGWIILLIILLIILIISIIHRRNHKKLNSDVTELCDNLNNVDLTLEEILDKLDNLFNKKNKK